MSDITPMREIYWNISGIIWMYVLALFTLIVFGLKFYQRYKLWKIGSDDSRLDQTGLRLKLVFKYAFAQGRLLKKKYAGLLHVLIYAGFIILFIGTVLIFIQVDFTEPLFSWTFLKSTFYLYYSLILDRGNQWEFVFFAQFEVFSSATGRDVHDASSLGFADLIP